MLEILSNLIYEENKMQIIQRNIKNITHTNLYVILFQIQKFEFLIFPVHKNGTTYHTLTLILSEELWHSLQ